MKLIHVTFYKLKMMLGDKLFFSAMVLIPLFITLATGYALRYEKLGTIPVAIVDEDNSDYSGLLVERLAQKSGLTIMESSSPEAAALLKNNAVEAVFVLRQGFKDKIVSGEPEGIIYMIKAPSSFSSGFIQEVVAGEAVRFVTNNMAADWVQRQYGKLGKPSDEKLRRDVIEYADSQWLPKPLMTIDYREIQGTAVSAVKTTVMPAATATSTGIIIVFIMFYILFGSSWLIEERLNGTLKRLVAGPGGLLLSFAGNLLALFLSGMLQVMAFTLIDRLLFGVDLLPGIWSYFVFAAYLLSVIAISLFLSSVLPTPAQLQAAAPLVALLTGFAGGCFWNFVEIPQRLKIIALFTPEGWALKGINNLLLDPSSFRKAILPAAVLLTAALILIPASYIIIRVQADK